MRFFILLIAAIVFLWAGGLAFFVLSSLQQPLDIPPTDAIVVFTGAPGRVEKGLELFGKHQAKNLFISGVHPDVQISEIIQKAPQEIPECCISLDKVSRTTIENAAQTKEWASANNISSVLLVTSEYHMHRSLLEMAWAMPELKINTYVVQEYLPHQSRWGLFYIEYHKTLYRWSQLMTEKLTGETA